MADQVDHNRVAPRSFCAGPLTQVNRRLSTSKKARQLPYLPPSPPFHALVSEHSTLHAGKQIRLLLPTHHSKHNYAQERHLGTHAGRQDRRPPWLGKERALWSRIACYAKRRCSTCAVSWEVWRRSLSRASPHLPPLLPASQLEGPLQPLPASAPPLAAPFPLLPPPESPQQCHGGSPSY